MDSNKTAEEEARRQLLYVYIYIIQAKHKRKHSQHDIYELQWTKRTHFLIKIYLSHFIRKGWCFLYVRGELETETDCHILTPSSSDHSSTYFAFWLGSSTVGPEGPIPLSGAGSHSGMHLIFTQVHLVTDGSVEGQYTTVFVICPVVIK